MPEDGANLIPLRPANSPNAFDLRRVGPIRLLVPAGLVARVEARQGDREALCRRAIVLYRGMADRVFALEDRCAHRQVPLHLGVVRGDELKCHYHGWAYDGTGKCIDVPYLGKERLPNGVKSYPARESTA